MYSPSHKYVVGAGSKLFQSFGAGFDFTAVSGRMEALPALPEFVPGSLILVLADPPDLHQTQALLLSLLSRVPEGAGCRLVYVSTISVTFGQSKVFPYEGPYARKKRTAEQLLLSREDLDVCLLRVGNVFDHGGWRAIRDRTRCICLPAGFDSVAMSDAPMVRAALDRALRLGPGHHVLDAWQAVPSGRLFRRIVRVPGLLAVYRAAWAKVPMKLMGRLLRLLGIYLPAHDDLNSFLLP